jgi:hypothetical protein
MSGASLKESELRDLLVGSLDVLEPGLTFLSKEQYIPNALGTRGFIDILARDSQNHLVLIELKRSDQSSREAIHEVLKYVEGVKQHLGVRDHEIRVLIISTEWQELLVPFSRFAAESNLMVQGIKVAISETDGVDSEIVRPLSLAEGRFIAPWHELNLYESQKSMERGLVEIQKALDAKGVRDYVVLVMEPAPNFNQVAKAKLQQALMSIHGDAVEAAKAANQLPDYQYLLYVGVQMLSQEACLLLLKQRPAVMDEVIEIIVDMEGDELLHALHEYVLSGEPSYHRDRLEIGYPAKLKSRLIEDEGWSVSRVERFGTFARNPILQDEDILAELCGTTGNTGQILKRTASVANKAHMTGLRNDLRACLQNNPGWTSQLLHALEDIESEHPNAEIDVQIYNPSAGIMTIYHAATDEEGLKYCPSYWINIRYGGTPVRMYVGGLRSEGEPMDFTEILQKYYDGDIFGLLLTMSWGGYESRDSEILEDLGLRYRTVRVDIDGDARHFHEFSDGRWRSVRSENILLSMFQFMDDNRKLVQSLVDAIGAHRGPGMWAA